ncbi:hypothetical protein EBU99_13730, partial [bacterium]|nr:hypothetical protein [bacterium]
MVLLVMRRCGRAAAVTAATHDREPHQDATASRASAPCRASRRAQRAAFRALRGPSARQAEEGAASHLRRAPRELGQGHASPFAFDRQRAAVVAHEHELSVLVHDALDVSPLHDPPRAAIHE